MNPQTTKQNLPYDNARRRVLEVKDFYVHFLTYVIVNLCLLIFNAITYDGFWWFILPLAGWGIGIIAHACSVFLFHNDFWHSWEDRQIEKIMKRRGK